MKTGKCKFGSTCKFHHPNAVLIQSIVEENINGLQKNILGENKAVQTSFAPALLHNSKGLPIRPVWIFQLTSFEMFYISSLNFL